MLKRLMLLVVLLACVCLPAHAAGSLSGKETHLVPQEGAYDPRYSLSCAFDVPTGEPFEIVVYQDTGSLQLRAVRNGGNLPPGADIYVRQTAAAGRVAYIKGTILTGGTYSFGVLIQEPVGEGKEMTTLAILQVTLRVSGDVETVEKYLGDGCGMLRLTAKGVNFRRTPGGTRLGTYDKGTRFVWCSTQEKGGYTWYRVWSEDYGYGYIRGDMVQVEPPLRIVYTPGKETAFTLFITPDTGIGLIPSLIMTEAPEEIGFDTELPTGLRSLVNVTRGGDIWTLLCFCIEEEKAFWIQADLRDEYGVPLECQMVYLTTKWEETPEYVSPAGLQNH